MEVFSTTEPKGTVVGGARLGGTSGKPPSPISERITGFADEPLPGLPDE